MLRFVIYYILLIVRVAQRPHLVLAPVPGAALRGPHRPNGAVIDNSAYNPSHAWLGLLVLG